MSRFLHGTCLALAAVAALASSRATEGRPITPDDLWAMQRVGQPVVSPDGRHAAFVVSRSDVDANAIRASLWLMPTDPVRHARRVAGESANATTPFWSPDSRRLGFILGIKGQPAQLLSVDLAGGEPQPIKDLPVSVRRARWLAGGRYIVFEALTFPDLNERFDEVRRRLDATRADKTQAKTAESRLLRYWDRYLTDGQVPHLFELDLTTSRVRDLMPGFDRLPGLDSFEWDVSPDGGEIAFSANATDPPHRTLNYDVYVLDRATGGIRNLTADSPGADVRPAYSPRGRELLVGRTLRPGVGSDFAHLTLLQRGTGPDLEVAAELDARKSDWVFARDGRSVVFAAEKHGRTHLYRADTAGGRATLVAEGGNIDAPDVLDGATLFLRHDYMRPAEIHRAALDGRAEQRITAFNDARVAAIDFGKVEELTYRGADGEPVHTWLVHPPQGRSGRKPVLVLLHGGPFAAWTDSFSYRWNPHVFAARGWLVAMPNFHGSTGYGQRFADSILGNHGEKPSRDVLALLDALKSRGDVDLARAAVAGGSYGGYLASLMTGLTDRFRAAVVHAGVFDLSGQFASDATWDRPTSYGHAPWTDPEALDAWSPSRFAPRMQTPTLVLHGEKDYRVPATQGINLYGVLTGKGVPARIVIFPDENHWILKPQASLLWHREFFAWLDRHAGPKPGNQ
jgi:dipeptidyl aminopeptidase/acylaminoacyl peptidase